VCISCRIICCTENYRTTMRMELGEADDLVWDQVVEADPIEVYYELLKEGCVQGRQSHHDGRR
jgi:hypothetical protein